jgi:hypothetical protein
MLLSELTAKLMDVLRTSGDMKLCISDDLSGSPLWMVKAIGIDTFCPDCNTPYCTIDLMAAPGDYFDDGPCCE